MIFLSTIDEHKCVKIDIVGFDFNLNPYRIEIEGTRHTDEEKAILVINKISDFIINYTSDKDIKIMESSLLNLIHQRDELNERISKDYHTLEDFKSGNRTLIWD